MSFTIKIQGLSDLDRKLREFGPKVAAKGLRSANFQAAKVFRDYAKSHHDRWKNETGLLESSIAISRRSTPANVAEHVVRVRATKKVAKVAVRRKGKKAGKYHEIAGPAAYGKFLEYGTSKMQAKPFLRPAFDANVQNAIEADKSSLATTIDRLAKE